MLPKNRRIRGPPSGEPVAAVVARGEAEIGFQQVSELMNVAGVDYVGTIPAELQPGFTFAGVLTRSAGNADAATALLRFLNSPEADAVKTKAGLMPAADNSDLRGQPQELLARDRVLAEAAEHPAGDEVRA